MINLLTRVCPFLWNRRCSVGKFVGLVARLALPLTSTGFARFWCSDLSIIIFLQISRNVLAMVRAGISHRNTWHMCFLVERSLATYAKSLQFQLWKYYSHQNIPKSRVVIIIFSETVTDSGWESKLNHDIKMGINKSCLRHLKTAF